MKLAPLALAALIIGLPIASLAQAAPAPAPAASPAAHQHGHRGGHMMRMVQSLNLTADQKTKIDGYMTAAKTANQNVTDPQVRRTNMQNLRTQIMGVLTPDQQAQLKAKMEAARKDHEAGAPKPQ